MDADVQAIMERTPFSAIDLVLYFMKKAEMTTMLGLSKRDYVTSMCEIIISQVWGMEVANKYKELIPDVIEFVVKISKNDIVIDINKAVKNCCSII